jgi:hypothetical protein
MISKKLIPLLALAAFAFSQVQAQKKTENYSWTNLPKIQQPVFKKDTLCITAFGAVPDGITLNTKAINSAIDACSKKGGGVVLVPAGLWMTGPVVMKSNVNPSPQPGGYPSFYPRQNPVRPHRRVLRRQSSRPERIADLR